MERTDVTPPDGKAAAAKDGAGAIVGGSGIAALAVFILQNTDDVSVTFLFWSFTWPVWLLILVSALLGTAIWVGLGILRRRRRRKARRDARLS